MSTADVMMVRGRSSPPTTLMVPSSASISASRRNNHGDEANSSNRAAGVAHANRRRANSGSRFAIENLPSTVLRRSLMQYSVHCSPTTRKWIATITRTVDDFGPGLSKRVVQFCFSSEREARKFVKAYTPPHMRPIQGHCHECQSPFGTQSPLTNKANRPVHCRNCGVCICDKCSTRWGNGMVPRTFLNTAQSTTVRVCKSCDWLSNSFCISLLQGNYDDALKCYETGNVNLRTSFADINGEAMFPVHCAAMGGSVQLLSWLVDGNACPISVQSDPQRPGRPVSIQTSEGRTLIDLAMTGKVKVDILRYLIVDKNLSINDAKDKTLASRSLEALLRTGVSFTKGPEDLADLIHEVHSDSSVTTGIEDACPLCCEKPMDCVLLPCGHQVCCLECGEKLQRCPVCKVDCSVLKIFRQ